MIHNIPSELRRLPQWVVSAANKIPLNPRTGQPASVIDPSTWSTFEEALKSGYKHLGFVLAEWDEFTIIDLDNKPEKPCTPEQWARHQKILEAFASYTEKSASGTGYHIVVKGKLPKGVHRDNVEAYSSSRYMICTGNVVRNLPIADFQPLLNQLYSEMAPQESVGLDEVGEAIGDQELVQMASDAVNGEKFDQLCRGEWQALGYPSQSEADLALLSIFAFYTRSNDQVRRLFRYSKLGQREKAQRNDRYLDFALSKIRAKEPPPVDIDALRVQAEAKALAPAPLQTPRQEAQARPIAAQLKGPSLPPGLVGEMASYFFQTAVRPVEDIALAAALALTSGVAARSYNVSGTGLNQYLILIAKTGTGKEGAVTGIDNLVAAVRPQVPMVDQFVGPSAFASGQALIKVLDERPCFVSVLGEFGLTLQQLCDPQASSAQVMLRKVLLDLYSKSGWSKVLRSSVYSDVEKNTKIVQAPNVTILGESTPETFFEGLDSSHISEGLIPRFSIIQYTGPRPPRNHQANNPPPASLVQRFAELVTVALTTSNNGTCVAVQIDGPAQTILDAFDREADAEINGADNDVENQLWNRAHLKALKLSSLLAVGCNPHQPIVNKELAEWAIAFVRRDVVSMTTRFRSNDVGTGDGKAVSELHRVIQRYLETPFEELSASYGVTKGMHTDRVVPYMLLARRTANLTSFKAAKMGASFALKNAIQSMVDSGALVELAPGQITQRYRFNGKVWALGSAWSSQWGA